MSKPFRREPINHASVAKTLKSLGLYTGKTTRLEKKDKDRINRAYAKFSYAAENPSAWKGVKVSKAQAKEWKKRGLAVFDERVMVYAKGYDHIKKTRSGDLILSNAEKSKRFTLTTDPTKLERMANRYGNIGVQIGGVSIHRSFESWDDAVAYAQQLRSRFQSVKGKEDLMPLPVFIEGEPGMNDD